MSATRVHELRERLAHLKARGIVRDWQCQSQMPGLRWTIWLASGSGWTYSGPTREALLVVRGMVAVDSMVAPFRVDEIGGAS